MSDAKQFRVLDPRGYPVSEWKPSSGEALFAATRKYRPRLMAKSARAKDWEEMKRAGYCLQERKP